MRTEKLFRLALCLTIMSTAGCWVAAAGVGAEAGYVASQEDRSAGQTLDDQRITSVVKTKLIAESDVAARNINVDTFKGVVTLRGFVKTPAERDRAVQLAEGVSGVLGVESRLTIQ